VRQIENYPTSEGDVPLAAVIVTDCGELSADDPSLTEKAATDSGDSYEDYPDDEDCDLSKPETVIEIAKVIREIGNKLFKEGKIEEAHQKYQSRCFDRSSSIFTPPSFTPFLCF
jgi:peptidyl-prolyl isomerase D